MQKVDSETLNFISCQKVEKSEGMIRKRIREVEEHKMVIMRWKG